MAVDWTRPTLTTRMVASMLPTRVVKQGGRYAGDFDGTTRPTAEQVLAILDTSKSDVFAEVGDVFRLPKVTKQETADLVIEAWRSVIILRACYYVELTYFPEQIKNDRSAAEHYLNLYTVGLESLRRLIERLRNYGDDGDDGDASGNIDSSTVWFSFPDDDCGRSEGSAHYGGRMDPDTETYPVWQRGEY